MSRSIPESDWRRFRQIHTELRDQFCARVLAEAQIIATSTQGSAHERYIRLLRHMERCDDELAGGFDEFRRSTALQQLLVLRGMGLLSEDHILSLTEETQLLLRAFAGDAKH